MAEYLFELRPVRDERLLPQLAAALDKCGELSSRGRLPALWKLIDRMGGAQTAPEEVLRRRRTRRRIYGGVLTAAGLFLLIPALTAPRELTGPLLVGAFAVAWGLYSLLRRGGASGKGGEKRPLQRYEKEARQLLDGLAEAQRAGVYVRFTDKELTVEAAGERKAVAYAAFACAAETRDLLLLRGEASGLVLQKRELAWGNWEAFRAFLSERGVPAAPVYDDPRGG